MVSVDGPITGAWIGLSLVIHARLVMQSYFQAIKGFTAPEYVKKVQVERSDGQALFSDPVGFLRQALETVMGGPPDPFNAVIAYRNFKPVHE